MSSPELCNGDLYDVYEIEKYAGWTKDAIKNNIKQYNLITLIKKVCDDHGYHVRIDPKKYYTFFGDIDGHIKGSTDFFDMLLKFLKDFYDISVKLDDISYTKNNSKNGSYHYSIPKIYCNCLKIKEIIGNFKTEYEKIYDKGNIIDTTIYSNHWFRLPNQTKEGVEGTEHFVVRGELIDFIPEFILDTAKCIDDKKYNGKELILLSKNNKETKSTIDINKLQKGKFEKNDIKKLVNMLDKKRLNNYQDWLNVGICLKNINSSYLELWDRWSENGEKYDDSCCEKKWKTFNKDSDKKLGVGSLIKWANDDNKDRLKNFLSERNIKNVIKTNKKEFPNNELEIDEIIQNDEFHYVGLKDRFCPFYGDEHSESGNMYLEFTCPDKYSMKCHKCVGKSFPCKHIKLKIADSKNIFNTLIVNNYYNEEENLDFEIVKIIEDEKLNKLVFDVLNCPSDRNYAKIVYFLYPDKYIYDVNTWYEFKNHRWVKKIGENTKFLEKSIDEIINLLNKCVEYYKDDKKTSSHIKKQIEKIGNDNTTHNITNFILKKFSYACSNIDINPEEGTFQKKMDKNPYLLGFTNGVYDFKKLEFRDGTPDDFISLTVGYAYVDKHTDKLNDIKKFFKDIQPEKEQREYLLTFLGSCLLGTQKDEIYTIFTGGTRNGKTTCMDLLSLILGNDYYETISSTFLTRPSPESGKPVPEILNLEFKRVVCTSENDANNSLNTGLIKGYTGGDQTGGRQLHSKEIIRFKPQFKLISLFNDIPNVDKLDAGFWSKCKVVNFPTTFVKNPKNKNELPIDKDLKEKLVEWKQDFMLLLIEYCKKYIKYGLIFPKSVEKQTEKYKNSVDCYENFINDCIEKDNSDAISWKDLRFYFCNWYKENIDDRIPNAKEIMKNFEKRFKEKYYWCRDSKQQRFRGWKGYKIKEEEEEE